MGYGVGRSTLLILPIRRIANHFNSPRVRSEDEQRLLYTTLKASELHETDGISSDLVLKQDNVQHTVEGKIQTLHIDESNLKLKVYIPQNKDDQEYIFTNLLSRRLFEWMMEDRMTHISGEISDIIRDGVNATRDVMLAPRSRLNRALDDNGIATIDTANTDDKGPFESDSPETTPVRVIERGNEAAVSVSDLVLTPATSNAGLPPDRSESPLPSESGLLPPNVRIVAIRSALSSSRGDSPNRPVSISPPGTPRDAVPRPDMLARQGYVALLDKVIELGRRNALPRDGALDRDLLRSSLRRGAGSSDWGLSYLPQMERDCKVGAAGELYVSITLPYIPFPGMDS